MLVGRGEECGLIDRLLADATSGRSGVVVLRGEAGIGKSAICDYARERATGFTILRCRGVESEAELAFAALGDLFRPVLDQLDAIPAPQAAALAAALAIGPPTSLDRYSVCAATLSLLAAVADDKPVLVLVDDAQWLDASSAETLLFAARRLEAEEVAVLIAARAGEAPLVEQSGLPEVELDGLQDENAFVLLETTLARGAAPEVVHRLVEATGGNPLALLEIAGGLAESELDGSTPLPEPLPVGPTLERAFLRRAAALPEPSQRGLLVVAAAASAAAEAVARALELLDVERPREALEAAEAAGLLTLDDGRVEFRHPLIRSAVYYAAPASARRAAHKALVAASAGESGAAERAWHLAAAAPGPDEDIAAMLERTALDSRRRGGRAEAASAFERAAHLTRDEGERRRRLIEAADDFRRAGRADRAFALLDETLALVGDDALMRAKVAHLRGRVEMWRGGGLSTYDVLAAEAGRVEELAPAKAALMSIDAVMLALIAGDIHAAKQIAVRACAAGERAGGALAGSTTAALAAVKLLQGEHLAPDLFALPPEALAGEIDLGLPAHQLSAFVGSVLVWLERYDEARSLLVGVIERARAASAPPELPYALVCLADLDFRAGRWAAAYAGSAESVRLAEETLQTGVLPYSLGCLGRVEAATGREDECRAHLSRAIALAEEFEEALNAAFARAALGLLELGLGRPKEAIAALEAVRAAVAERGLSGPNVIQWAPDLIEAYVRVGREDEAAEALAAFTTQAETSGSSWPLAAAARGRGLLAAGDSFEEAFAVALDLHEQTAAPFELARTELCLGERLRRARRRADARVHLRAALETFERLGAVPWMERARGELNASGETLRRGEMPASHELTPQELQVALVVGRGATNREAGAALFLSSKTIETHLGRIYRKLNVRSRTELASLLAREGALEEVAA